MRVLISRACCLLVSSVGCGLMRVGKSDDEIFACLLLESSYSGISSDKLA